jgi:hypothetical protein
LQALKPVLWRPARARKQTFLSLPVSKYNRPSSLVKVTSGPQLHLYFRDMAAENGFCSWFDTLAMRIGSLKTLQPHPELVEG